MSTESFDNTKYIINIKLLGSIQDDAFSILYADREVVNLLCNS